jgi:hypothetical protein
MRCLDSSFGTDLLLIIAAVVSMVASGCLSDGSSADQPKIDVECPVALQLGPESGTFEDWSGGRCSWESASNDGKVTLTRRSTCGDECGVTEEIVLEGLDQSCPKFVSARVTRTDAGGALGRTEETTRAQKGVLKIQDWGAGSGIISGHLESEVTFTFYASWPKK